MLDLRTRCASLIKPRPGRRTAVLLVFLFLGLAAAVHAAEGAPRRPIEALAEMELVNRHYVMSHVLGRRRPRDYGKLLLWETFTVLAAAPTDDGRVQVMVELQDPPDAVVFAAAMRGTVPSDKRALAVAGAASKAQVLKVKAAQDGVAAALAAAPIGARELYRVTKALNGIAVAVAPENLHSLAAIPGVKRILPILLEHPTSSTSVPFIGAPQVWANTIGLPAGADGTGVKIGIIDTGIDYLRGDFGGSGLLSAYQAESTATANFTTAGSFPTAKVVGGTDFAGDAYTGVNAPVPDANPMDCNGHGSHVSGTAAGFGVTAAGATFTGPYDGNNSTYTPLRIVPGAAPKALLYALRVFGCAGSTGLTTLAIDWAMDPNDDGDLSDHLDVINMSLGSAFGSAIKALGLLGQRGLAGVNVIIRPATPATLLHRRRPEARPAVTPAASVDSGDRRVSAPLAGRIASYYPAQRDVSRAPAA
jgi:hypothetical protein